MAKIDYDAMPDPQIPGAVRAKNGDPAVFADVHEMRGWLKLQGSSVSFSSPLFNLIASLVCGFMALFAVTQLWAAILVVGVLVWDFVRTIKRAKAAGKGWSDWKELLKELQAEGWAVVLTVAAFALTFAPLLVIAAGILFVDSLTEL